MIPKINFSYLKKQTGLSYKEIAFCLGINEKAIYKIEKKKLKPGEKKRKVTKQQKRAILMFLYLFQAGHYEKILKTLNTLDNLKK